MLTVRRVLRVRHGPGWLLPRQWLTGGRGPGTGPAERRGQERDRPARACAFLAAVPAGVTGSDLEQGLGDLVGAGQHRVVPAGHHDRGQADPGGELGARPGQGPVVLAEDGPGRYPQGGDVVDVDRVEEVAARLREEQLEEQVLACFPASGMNIGTCSRARLIVPSGLAPIAARISVAYPGFSSAIAVPRAGTTAL